jgi:thiamine pyrophosphokinase
MTNKLVTIVLPLATLEDLPFIQGDVIAVDGGASFLQSQHISPMMVIGDLDSLSQTQQHLLKTKAIPIQVHPPVKDRADTLIALDWAISQNYEHIQIVGFSGGRLDHYQAIIQGVASYDHPHITLMSSTQRIHLLQPGEHILERPEGMHYVSMFSLTDSLCTIQQAKYPIDQRMIRVNDTYGLSNEWIDNKPIRLTIHRGRLLVFFS